MILAATVAIVVGLASPGQSALDGQGAVSPPRPAGPPTFKMDDDYPAEALRLGQQGKSKVSLTISAKGRVTECLVMESSGSASLDAATCRVMARLSFLPARDGEGHAVQGRLTTAMNWVLPRH